MARKTEVLNVRLPRNTIKLLDLLVEQGRFSSRSEAIREFSRQYVMESRGDSHAR